MHSSANSISIFLIGGDNVGKSCFLHRLIENQYDSTIPSTVGVTHHQSQLIIKGENIKIDIYDTPGVERYKYIVSSYLRSANGFLIFYDITDGSSLEEASYWINEIRYYTLEKVDIMLVGTKCDLESQRKITNYTINCFAENKNIKLIRNCSALNGDNVNEIFTEFATIVYERVKREKEEE